MAELAETMLHGVPPKCGGQEGMRSIMIDQAHIEGRVLDLTDTWRSLGITPG